MTTSAIVTPVAPGGQDDLDLELAVEAVLPLDADDDLGLAADLDVRAGRGRASAWRASWAGRVMLIGADRATTGVFGLALLLGSLL